MLQKTRGIVLSFVRYRETSIIVKIFTEAFGVQSYIVNSVRSSKAVTPKIALYQPLTLLELVVYFKEKQGVQRISEAKCIMPYVHIPFDFRKTTIFLFINEVLIKSIKEESGNAELFEFVFSSLRIFDLMTDQSENFHLRFMLKLSRFLGFPPTTADDLFNFLYQADYKSWEGMVEEGERLALDTLLQTDYTTPVAMTGHYRRILLERVVSYFKKNIEGFGELKSLEVLREVVS